MHGAFDPRLCPLLAHLPPEEQEQRVRDDPLIAKCIRKFGLEAAVCYSTQLPPCTGAITSADPLTGKAEKLRYWLPEGVTPVEIGIMSVG